MKRKFHNAHFGAKRLRVGHGHGMYMARRHASGGVHHQRHSSVWGSVVAHAPKRSKPSVWRNVREAVRPLTDNAMVIGAGAGAVVGGLVGGPLGAAYGAASGLEIGGNVQTAASVVDFAFPNNNMVNPEHEAAGIYSTFPKVQGKKKVKQHNKRIPKINKAFRAKVNKVINDKLIHGHFHQYSQQTGDLVKQIYAGNWSIFPGGGMGLATTLVSSQYKVNDAVTPPWLFTPNMFFHAVSACFAGKPGTWQTLSEVISSNAGYWPNFGSGALGITGATRLKFNVKTSHATYRYKNLQSQAVHMMFFVCKPKKKSSYNPQYYSDTGGGSYTAALSNQDVAASTLVYTGNTATDTSSLLEPVSYLIQTTIIDNSAPNNVLSLTHAPTGIDTPQISAAYGFGLDPIVIPSFRNGYTFERVSVTLQPGQEYILTVQGPKNMEIDSSKLFIGDNFQNIQMYSRSVMVAVMNEISAATATNTVPMHFPTTTSGYGVSCEMNLHIKVSMPEETIGGTTAGAMNDLKYRRPFYVYSEGNVNTTGTVGKSFNAQNAGTHITDD